MPRTDVSITTRDGVCPASALHPRRRQGTLARRDLLHGRSRHPPGDVGDGAAPGRWRLSRAAAGSLLSPRQLSPDGPGRGAGRPEAARRADEIRQQPRPRSQGRRCRRLHRIPVVPARGQGRPVRRHGLLHGRKCLPDRRRRLPRSLRGGRVLSRRQSRHRQARQPASLPGKSDGSGLCRRRHRGCVPSPTNRRPGWSGP